MASDASLQQAIAEAFGIVNTIVASSNPAGIGIPMAQLIDQLQPVASGSRKFLRVYSGGRTVKKIPLRPTLMKQCARIQRYLWARLLLFEDLAVGNTDVAPARWVSSLAESSHSASRGFQAGSKAQSLTRLATNFGGKSRKLVVFVRNVAVSEGVCVLLSREGLRTVFVHGETGDPERSRRLNRFKKGDVEVLVATRKLFGRGFDLPEADAAVFYSPKTSARTMWHEMLRIRATVVEPKPVFILFYAWTAEASKLGRLIQGMNRTGAIWQHGWFQWMYSEPEVLEDEEPDQEPVETSHSHSEIESATRDFVSSLVGSVQALSVESSETVLRSLEDVAERTGFMTVWPAPLVRSLLLQLAKTIVTLRDHTDLSPKRIRRRFSKLFHPDKHLNASGVEEDFWHELSVALSHVPSDQVL
jgi:hypothetical protein